MIHPQVQLFAALADMKEVDYKNALAISSLIDLLIQKGIITRDEIAGQMLHLDATSE
jgi:hypothetical protein